MSRCRDAALALALLAWAGLSAGQGSVQTGAANGAVGKGGSNLPNIAPNIPPNIAQSSARYPGIGRSATANEIAAWDIDVRPDFKGLPAGSGSVAKGQEVWEGKCASCHGVFGEASNVYNPLVGGTTTDDIQTGRVARLRDPAFPGRTTLMKVSSLSTLWDYINRQDQIWRVGRLGCDSHASSGFERGRRKDPCRVVGRRCGKIGRIHCTAIAPVPV